MAGAELPLTAGGISQGRQNEEGTQDREGRALGPKGLALSSIGLIIYKQPKALATNIQSTQAWLGTV